MTNATLAPRAPQAPRSRPAVLLLHGLCANPLELAPVAKSLREQGFVVEVPAIAGYGVPATPVTPVARGMSGLPESLEPPGPCNPMVEPARMQPSPMPPSPMPPFEHWLADAQAVYDRLQASHGQVVIGGLCMGAVLGLALAARRPAAALVMISTTLHFDGWNVSPWRRLLPLAYLPGLRDRLRFKETRPYGLKNERMRAWVAQAMASAQVSAAGAASLPAAGLYQASRLIRHVRCVLPQLHAPALVLHATEDDVAGPRSVHELYTRLGRIPEIHWFHDSYHMLTLDNERAAVCDAVRSFLLRQFPDATSRMAPAVCLNGDPS